MSSNLAPKKGEVRAVLYTVSGFGAGDAIKLRRDATILGREKGDVLVTDHEVSSTHCQIQNINGIYHIFDMNSTNGTFVNKNRIVKSRLNQGDEVMIGKTVFRFALEEDAKVRHITTIFRGNQSTEPGTKGSLVDTLIEDEVRKKQSYAMWLAIKYGDGTTENIELPHKQIYLGRATNFGQFENDAEISRKHLLIKLNDHGEVFVEDQGSTNGTYLNGAKIRGMHPLTANDVIRLGSIEVKVAVKTG